MQIQWPLFNPDEIAKTLKYILFVDCYQAKYKNLNIVWHALFHRKYNK